MSNENLPPGALTTEELGPILKKIFDKNTTDEEYMKLVKEFKKGFYGDAYDEKTDTVNRNTTP